MEITERIKNPDNQNPCLALQEFCDMEQLYQLLSNWSNSSGMSAVIVDACGDRVSESYGMTEFCTINDSLYALFHTQMKEKRNRFLPNHAGGAPGGSG